MPGASPSHYKSESVCGFLYLIDSSLELKPDREKQAALIDDHLKQHGYYYHSKGSKQVEANKKPMTSKNVHTALANIAKNHMRSRGGKEVLWRVGSAGLQQEWLELYGYDRRTFDPERLPGPLPTTNSPETDIVDIDTEHIGHDGAATASSTTDTGSTSSVEESDGSQFTPAKIAIKPKDPTSEPRRLRPVPGRHTRIAQAASAPPARHIAMVNEALKDPSHMRFVPRMGDLQSTIQLTLTSFFQSLHIPTAQPSPLSDHLDDELASLFRECWGDDWRETCVALREKGMLTALQACSSLIASFLTSDVLQDGASWQMKLCKDNGLIGSTEGKSASSFAAYI